MSSVEESLRRSHYGRRLLPYIASNLDQIEVGEYYSSMGQTYIVGNKIVFHTANDEEVKRPKYGLSYKGKLLLLTDDPQELSRHLS